MMFEVVNTLIVIDTNKGSIIVVAITNPIKFVVPMFAIKFLIILNFSVIVCY